MNSDNSAPFELDRRLVADTLDIGNLTLSRVLLMNDSRFPWVILVPQQPGLCELGDLNRGDRLKLMDEISGVGDALTGLYQPDKLNVAMLGNIVPQLHIHVIARMRSDAAWPWPVWGRGAVAPYQGGDATTRVGEIRGALSLAI